MKKIDELCNKAKEKWGMRLQFIVTIEELAELTQELTKYIRLIDTNDELNWDFWNGEIVDEMVEEIADVELMLYQIKRFWNLFEEVKDKMNEKIERTLERIVK